MKVDINKPIHIIINASTSVLFQSMPWCVTTTSSAQPPFPSLCSFLLLFCLCIDIISKYLSQAPLNTLVSGNSSTSSLIFISKSAFSQTLPSLIFNTDFFISLASITIVAALNAPPANRANRAVLITFVVARETNLAFRDANMPISAPATA